MPMIKRGRGRPKKSDPVPYAEFMKPFIPGSNARQMKIPPFFVQKFGGLLRKKIQLMGPNAKTWDVWLEEEITSGNRGVFIRDGWKEFAEYYDLKADEFLVFKHFGHHLFLVVIFREDGCQRSNRR